MKSRVRDRRDKNNKDNIFCDYTQIETMERKPFEVETATKTEEDHKPYAGVDDGGCDVTSTVDSFEEEQKKLVYRGWKVMPFIIGNAFFFFFFSFRQFFL